MYNDTYINVYKEEDYQKYLDHSSLLDRLRESYYRIYQNDSDANKLAFKESLDHYVCKQLTIDPNFKNTQYFKNYCAYLKELIQEAYITIGGKKYLPEINKNVLFSKKETRNIVLNELQDKKEEFTAAHEAHIEELKRIYKLMKAHKPVTQSELILLSDYIYGTRNINKAIIDTYLEYMFNDLPENITSHPAISGALLSCFALVYNKDSKINRDSRFYVCEYDQGDKMHIAHSNSAGKYCVFQTTYLANMDLHDCKSLGMSRTNSYNDIYWIMMVSFHELTHQYQVNERNRQTLSSSGLSRSFNRILNKYMPSEYNSKGCLRTDYKANHDVDETELDADEESWKQCRAFINQFVNRDNRKYVDENGVTQDKWERVVDNAEAVSTRRTFSMKKDTTTRKSEEQLPPEQRTFGKYYAYYDIDNLIKIMKEHPEALKLEPSLRYFFNDDGTFNPIKTLNMNLLKSDDGTTHHQNNAAFELYTYASYFYGDQMYNEVNTKGISEVDAKNLISSLRYVYWGGKHKFEDLSRINSFNDSKFDGVDNKQFSETRHGYDFYNQSLIEKTFLYHYSITIKGMINERRMYKLIKSKYPNYNIRDVGANDYLYYISAPLEIIKNKIERNDERFMELYKNPQLITILERVKKGLDLPEVDQLVNYYIKQITEYRGDEAPSQGEGVRRK